VPVSISIAIPSIILALIITVPLPRPVPTSVISIPVVPPSPVAVAISIIARVVRSVIVIVVAAAAASVILARGSSARWWTPAVAVVVVVIVIIILVSTLSTARVLISPASPHRRHGVRAVFDAWRISLPVAGGWIVVVSIAIPIPISISASPWLFVVVRLSPRRAASVVVRISSLLPFAARVVVFGLPKLLSLLAFVPIAPVSELAMTASLLGLEVGSLRGKIRSLIRELRLEVRHAALAARPLHRTRSSVELFSHWRWWDFGALWWRAGRWRWHVGALIAVEWGGAGRVGRRGAVVAVASGMRFVVVVVVRHLGE
jgi:hypothetical protein